MDHRFSRQTTLESRLDVEEFERLIWQATPATLHDAVALYTGDLLPELGDEWAAALARL